MSSSPSTGQQPILTEEFVLQNAKAESADDVTRLKLWFKSVEDIECLAKFKNLRIVSLTDNKISKLKAFENCTKLQELYLRKNRISDWRELEYLRGLKELRVLWISENAIAETPNYRMAIISILPQLYKLDDVNVSAEERMEATGTTKIADVIQEVNKENKEVNVPADGKVTNLGLLKKPSPPNSKLQKPKTPSPQIEEAKDSEKAALGDRSSNAVFAQNANALLGNDPMPGLKFTESADLKMLVSKLQSSNSASDVIDLLKARPGNNAYPPQ